MLTRTLIALAGAIAAVAASFAAIPAHAYASFSIAMVDPAPGATGRVGTDAVTLRIAGPADHYSVSVEHPYCDDAWDYSSHVGVDHYGGVSDHRVELTDSSCTGTYDIEVTRLESDETRTLSFRLVEAPYVSSYWASSSTFWPHVKDGYRDGVRMNWRLSTGTTRSRIEVKNSAGRVVRKSSWTTRRSTSWRWDGRTTGGKKATKGTYRMVLRVEGPSGWKATKEKKVTLKHGVRTVKGTEGKTGYHWSRKDVRGNCHVTDSSYDETVRLDCWAGQHAQVDYVFKVPKNAHSLKFSVAGDNTLCCDTGVIQQTGTRISPTKYRVRVRVTDWRAYEVQRVRASWKSTRTY